MKSGNTPDEYCRLCYMKLARGSRIAGFDSRVAKRSADELCERIGDRYYVRDIAYKPTGVALGCPLPDDAMTRRLWRISRIIDNCLAGMFPGNDKRFAYVPPDYYHTTLVNYTHFDVDREIKKMTDDEMGEAKDVIERIHTGGIVLQLNGLILTNRGKLLARGFPEGDSLYELRSQLVDKIPGLRAKIPGTVHIKLGHMLVAPEGDSAAEILRCVAHCGEHISERISFTDAYTQLGRIPL